MFPQITPFLFSVNFKEFMERSVQVVLGFDINLFTSSLLKRTFFVLLICHLETKSFEIIIQWKNYSLRKYMNKF